MQNTTQEILNIVAIDFGFAQIKSVYNGKPGTLFSSAIADIPNAYMEGFGKDEGLTIINVNGLDMVVGGDALTKCDTVYYEKSMEWLVKYAPYFLGLTAKNEGFNLEDLDILAICLPPGDYKKYGDKMCQSLKDATIDGKKLKETIDIQIYPQGVGALYAYMHENEISPKFNDEDPEADRGLVIDIGGNTVNVIAHNNYFAVPKGTYQLNGFGVMSAAENLANKLHLLTDDYWTPIQAMEVLRGRKETVLDRLGNRLVIEEITSPIIASFIAKTMNEINSRSAFEMKYCNHFILSGGGGNIIKQEHFHDRYQQRVKPLINPEFGNARGIYYAAKAGL